MLPDIAGQRITAPLLKEADQILISACRLVKKTPPLRAVRLLSGYDGCEPGDTLVGHRCTQFAGSQIHGAARRAEKKRIAVPIAARHGEGRIRTTVSFHA